MPGLDWIYLAQDSAGRGVKTGLGGAEIFL
jgi:hypothetical protein